MKAGVMFVLGLRRVANARWVRPLAVALVGMVAGAGLAACAVGKPDFAFNCSARSVVGNISFTLTPSGGSPQTFATLRGNVKPGATVTANFSVTVPSGCETEGSQVSLASYGSPTSTVDLGSQVLLQSATHTFNASTSSGHLTVHAPLFSSQFPHFQIDFAAGPVANPPFYDGAIIDWDFE